MSQPPDPYLRQFNFANWNITHPGEPHQGDKIDLELNEVKESMDETQARLAEIQRDDGMIRPEALTSTLAQITQESADAAAAKTYADNLASVPNKLQAHANLQLPANYPKADGSTLWIYSNPLNGPVPPEGTPLSNQSGIGVGLLPTSTAFSRQFRASVLFGMAYDYPTNVVGGSTAPASSRRVDNVSMALLYGGTMGKPIDGQNPQWPANTFNGDYTNLGNLPSIENPFATVRNIVDAVDNREAAHLAGYDHLNLPTSDQKAAMDEAASPSASNPFATINDLSASGSLTADEVAAVAGSETPSASNVLVSTSALTTALGGKADATHTHTWDELTDSLGIPLQGIIDGKAEAVHVHDIADVTGLQAAIDGKAPTTHDHAISDVTNLQTSLDGKADATDAGIAKAWVSFDGSTTPATIKASRNVTSVTRSSAGIYLVNFSAGTFADANYCWVASGRNNGGSNGLIAGQDNTRKTQTTTQLHIVTRGDDGSLQDATWCNVVVYR